MAGTKTGGKKAATTNKAVYGPDFYRRIGRMGGTTRSGGTQYKGFGSRRELASVAGQKGGSLSKRGFRYMGLDANGQPVYADA